MGEVERMVAEIIQIPGSASFLRFEINNLELITGQRQYIEDQIKSKGVSITNRLLIEADVSALET